MKFSKIGLAITSAVICFSAYADTNQPTTFIGPTARLGFTTTLEENSAYSLLGEIGARNFRVGGTLGWMLAPNQYFKVSADYLWQRINYSFLSGDTDQWVRQSSIGAAYLYTMYDRPWAPQFDISAYYAQATSKDLEDRSGSYISPLGIPVYFTEQRRIAGADAAGIAPGVSIAPWYGGRIGAALNYDYVNYDYENSSSDGYSSGLGGTVYLSQRLANNLDLNLGAGIRQPFNVYGGQLTLHNVHFYGDWSLGVFGDYVDGKDALPNTWNVGLSANYFLDNRCPIMQPISLKGDLKGEAMVPVTDNLLGWTAAPAVYLPQVLATADSKTNICLDVPPTLLADIPEQSTPSAIGTANLAVYFAGSNLVFSIVSISPMLADGDFITLSSSGMLDYDTTFTQRQYLVVIRASNSCGFVLSNTFIVN